MPVPTDAEGSEDVNDFLSRIRDLSRKRDIEDEERTRKLEDDIIQGRKERQARRAERARSISPIKDGFSNADTPSSIHSGVELSHQEENSNTTSFQWPSSGPSGVGDIPHKMNGAPAKVIDRKSDNLPRQLPQSPSKPQMTTPPSPSAAAAPSRAGTLSWQQRPTSRGSMGLISRPLSAIASENNASKSTLTTGDRDSSTDDKMSRSQISQSLGSKDPTWFKQTQDRGYGSAAFRRNQDESSDTASMIGSRPLPGMSRESSAEPEDRADLIPDRGRFASPSREGSLHGVSGLGQRDSTSTSLASAKGIGSPLPTMSSQRFDIPSNTSSYMGENPSIARSLAMSPSQGRLSPERLDRPASPTKGLGGFVQSAMLKRSDSVNKRWSAQAGPGLSRVNSIASNRSAYEGFKYPVGGNTPLKDSGTDGSSREHSPETTRPGSNQSNATLSQWQIEDERRNRSTPLARIKPDSSQDEASDPAPADSKPPPSFKQDDDEPMMSPPASPSKKWSPSKASWLENAINKRESSKIMSPAPRQPAWMAEINRARQQRESIDLSKGGKFKEVAAGGLVRSPPPTVSNKPSGISAPPIAFSTSIAVKPRVDGPETVDQPSESAKTTNDNDDSRGSVSPQTPLMESETKANSFRKPPANEKSAESPLAKKHDFQVGSRTQSPNATKSKPETPPKIDLKSSLKSRQASGEAKSREEAEFKNVFGNLKRTQTQNYKAPNELRDNILRGKAGLAVIGNPTKTERKDEFKESLLKKKEGMVVPSASTRITSATSKLQEQNVPEAIARKQGLTKSARYFSNDSMEGAGEPTKIEALAKLQSQNLRDKPKPVPSGQPPTTVASAEEYSAANGSLGGDFASSLAGILRKGPLTNIGNSSMAHPSSDDHSLPSTVMPDDEQAASVGPQLKHATKARARGPKRRLPNSTQHYAEKDSPLSQCEPQSKLSVAKSKPVGSIPVTKSPILSHSVSQPESQSSFNLRHQHKNNDNNRKLSKPLSPRKPSTSIAQSLDSRTSSPTSQGHGKALQNATTKSNPSPKETKTPSTFRSTSRPVLETPVKETAILESPHVPSGLARDQERVGPAPLELTGSTPSAKGTAAMWEQSPSQPSQPRFPVQVPNRKDEEAALEEAAGLKSEGAATSPVGLGIETSIDRPKPSLNRGLPSPATPSPKSPPLPGKKPASIASRAVSTNLPSPANIALPSPATKQLNERSQTHAPEASDLLANIFDEHPSSTTNIGIDTQNVLNSRTSSDGSPKIKTLRKQIFEITDSGKLVPVPSHLEHILFEDRLYLCTHVFGTFAGTRKTEVYLWCGDGVPTSAMEDAQLFAKKAAKDNNGKLIVLKQGKETTNFFQALGGIVITRRGSGSRLESPHGSEAMYLLCGRQHVGQIAFDEVDLSPRSLCKGFPFIVSAGSGKVCLWKGSGSGADELGCARLIGMDLGLSGEIEEIDDGREPDAFWQCFPGGNGDVTVPKGGSAWHWQLKPSCEKYTTRLYKIDVEAPRPKSSSGFMQWGRRGSAPADTNSGTTAQVRDIVPFAQLDIMDDGVFVLDAFFEIFIILSIRSLAPAPQHKSTESAAFRAALVFAQEYGILAASAEDRPFVPAGSVVICSRTRPPNAKEVDDIPEGMRRAFRKWDDGTGFGECRVLPLSAALEATGIMRGSSLETGTL